MNRFVNFALASAFSIGLIGTASAADMAVKARPVAAPIVTYNWTGCYLGGNVGGGWHKVDQSANRRTDGTVFAPPLDFGSSDDSSFVGGVQIGCDYQFGGNWVVGVQGMFDFGDIRSRNNVPDLRAAAIAPYQQTRTRDIYTGTARLGYLFAPQVLGYVKGGGAWTRTFTEVYGTLPAPFLSESASADRSGWTVGGGLEWMFAPNWSVFAEYNYMDFGRRDVTFVAGPGTVGAPTINSTRLQVQTALVGVNWRFNLAQPVVAKY